MLQSLEQYLERQVSTRTPPNTRIASDALTHRWWLQVSGPFVRDDADTDGGGAEGGVDATILTSASGEVLSWPQYKSADGDAILRFVLAPAAAAGPSGGSSVVVVGWWCLGANRLEGTAADCLACSAVFAPTGSMEAYGGLPLGSAGRWIVNDSAYDPSNGSTQDAQLELVLMLTAVRAQHAELIHTGSVRRLAVKYNVSGASVAARAPPPPIAAAEEPSARRVAHRAVRTGRVDARRRQEQDEPESPIRDTIGSSRGAHRSLLQKQSDYVSGLGSAGRSQSRSRSLSPRGLSSPGDLSPPPRGRAPRPAVHVTSSSPDGE